MINPAIIAAAASLSSSVEAEIHVEKRTADNIVMDPLIRFDNVVPPMRRNGPAWQPSHSTKRKNKIRRQRAAGGRS